MIDKICEDIRMHVCQNCGGHYNKSTCVYCGNKNEELMHLEEELTHILNNTEINNDILLSLYSIRKYNIDLVNEILNKYNFEKYLSDRNNELLNKKDNFSDEDHKLLLYFADNNLFDKGKSINTLISELVKDRLNLSISEKLKLVKLFTSHIIEIATKYKPRVSINNDSDKNIGSSFYGFVDFNENHIKKWLEEKNYIEILRTVFHECTHSLQKSKMRKPNIASYYMLLETKEELIREIIPEYYEENYLLYSHEVEARFKAITETITYLELLGIEVKDKDKLLKEANEEYLLSTVEDRKINGKISNVNDIFDSILLQVRPVLLANFPLLGLEYKNENGILVRKNREELDYDYGLLYGNLDQESNLRNQELSELDVLYSYLNKRLSEEKTNQ